MNTILKRFRVQLGRASVVAVIATLVLAACGPTVANPIATPPTAAPPTAAPPTSAPPTSVPPTSAPTAAQPTAVPPTAAQPTAAQPTAPAATVAPDPMYYTNEPVSVIPAGVAGQPLVEAAVNTVIFGGPGTNYVVYGAFLGGVTAIATGISQDGLWYAISVPVAPGGNGWVSSTYVIARDVTGLPVLPTPPVPPTVELVPPAEGEPQAIALTQIYVRNGPGDTYPAYGIAQTNAKARVLGKSQDGTWLVVRLNPQHVGLGYGWVATAYTTPSNIESVPVVTAPTQPPPVQTTPPPSGAPSATAIDYVNLRSGPGTDYLLLGTVAPGATGEVTGKSQDGAWWQVKVPTSFYSPGLAWVSADWVVTSNVESVPVVTAPAPPPTAVPTQPPAANACVLVSQDPQDNSTYPPSNGFQMNWTVKNTSSAPWDVNSTDLVFLGAAAGQRLHQGNDYYDITSTVQPQATYTVSLPAMSPQTPGQYGEAWSIISGSTTLCTFWLIINVQ